MAEHSQHSRTNGKRNTKRTETPITKGEAAAILLSALTYCQRAGLSVTGYNEGTALRLSISGVNYDGGQIKPCDTMPAEVTPTEKQVTP
jgi:hypothetical protein